MDGYESTQKTPKSGNTIPIIAMNADVIQVDRKKCIDEGINDYASKHFKAKELLSLLDKWIS